MMEWKCESASKFTKTDGKVSYVGDKVCEFSVTEEGFTLNGSAMVVDEIYHLKDGDIIKGPFDWPDGIAPLEGITPQDIKWKFSDE